MTITSETLLGPVPPHWEIRPVQFCCEPLVGFPFSSEQFLREPAGVPLLRGDNITTGHLRWGDRSRWWNHSDGAFSRYLLSANDIVIGMDGSKVGRNYAIVTECDLPLLLVQRVTRLRPKSAVVPRFLYYSITNDRFHAHVDLVRTDPAIPHITLKDILSFKIALPPLEEQRKIAAFLDRKTAEIDAVIARKERLIALLQEERQALISRAVTRGLDAGVAMKDSGIPWLGEVPRHWEVRRVGTFCRVVRGASPRPAGDPKYFNGDAAPWITVAEITKDDDKYLQATDTFLTHEGQELSRTLPVGTFVLTNSGATLGVPKILKISGCINDGSVAFFDLLDTANKDFLYYFFTSQTQHLRERMNQGMGQPNLNTDLVRNIAVPFPPPTEQREIADLLDMRCQRSRDLVLLNQTQISKLREYRQALISAAVTGKIAVPHEVAT